jgi:hypothetical protein
MSSTVNNAILAVGLGTFNSVLYLYQRNASVAATLTECGTRVRMRSLRPRTTFGRHDLPIPRPRIVERNPDFPPPNRVTQKTPGGVKSQAALTHPRHHSRPSSATRRRGRDDCNRDGPAGFAAQRMVRSHVCHLET